MYNEGEGTRAWAIWNDCNGVFAGRIYSRRWRAQNALDSLGWLDAEVVPVRVLVEPEDAREMRDRRENEAEQFDPPNVE